MAIGMRHALTTASATSGMNWPCPVSLDCCKLGLDHAMFAGAKLVASPIKGAKKMRGDFLVDQNLKSRSRLYLGKSTIKFPILIKVCSTSVHECLISPGYSCIAMLHLVDKRSLKLELSKVLIAYIYA